MQYKEKTYIAMDAQKIPSALNLSADSRGINTGFFIKLNAKPAKMQMSAEKRTKPTPIQRWSSASR